MLLFRSQLEDMSKTVLVSVSIISLLSAVIYKYWFKKLPPKIGKKILSEELPSPKITPIDSFFSWEHQTPHPYRPFKNGDYKMTMAIRDLDPNNLIILEDTYLERTTLRTKLFDEAKTYGCHDSAIPALKEAYSFIFDFLCKRYPQYFSESETTITNKIRNFTFAKNPVNIPIEQVLRTIAENIEEDIYILIKNSEFEEYDEYVIRAAVGLFPSGFDPIKKMNLPLTKVHAPVPGYEKKLKFSMNKFFSRLRVNEFIVRNNWAVQTHSNLNAPTGSHAEASDIKEITDLDPNELDFNKVFFRVEKQSFTRLPKSKADLMFIRTYMTPFSLLRDNVDVNGLCRAIDGYKEGMEVYKKKIEWGEAIKKYLRRESNGTTNEYKKYFFVH